MESEPAPRKRLLLIVALVIAAAIAGAALLLALGQSAPPPSQGAFGYLEYKVEGSFLFLPFSGTVRVDIINVTEEGYWARITVKGIPGAQSKTDYYTWDDVPAYVKDIGNSTGNATIDTAFGPKRTDVYLLVDAGATYTTYIGTDPRAVYKMVAAGNGMEMTMSLIATDMEPIISGNRP
jgi:hypothetical protein